MTGRLVNRGFFHGPWLPVYGAGAVMLEVILTRMSYHFQLTAARCFFISMLLCTSLEYLLGVYLIHRRHIRYWDYSFLIYEYQGHICLISSLLFGIGGIVLHTLLSPHLHAQLTLSLSKPVSQKALWIALILLITCFLADGIYSWIRPNQGPAITYSVLSPDVFSSVRTLPARLR